MSKLLTKSKYLNGFQCPKLLWTQLNEPERVPKPDPYTQYLFDQGHVVGDLAKKRFPSGIDIPTDNFMRNITETQELLKRRKPLFEAGIIAQGIYSRLDILNPVNRDLWDIIEVKATTSTKEVHIDDVSFQKYCCEKSGLDIRKCFLAYINNQYVRHGEIDPEQFFILQDISVEVEDSTNGIFDRIESMFEVMTASQCPDAIIGKHCSNPYDCPINECWDFLPEGNIFDLYRGGKKCFELLEKGLLAIKDIPGDYKLTASQQIQKECEVSGQAHIDSIGISDFLSALSYPLYYLDFETISPAVPLFDGTRPYQAIPFQFSLHVVNEDGAKPKHFSYLASGTGDPRPVFLAELRRVNNDAGSIIVYNQGFEEGILKELAIAFPNYNKWVSQIRSRLVDLLIPFQKFHYYHPAQKGSASLKSVLPTLTGRSYEVMEFSDGQEASIAFLTATYSGSDVSEEERNKIKADLEEYCALDSEGMIWIVDKLRKLCT